VTWRVKSSCRPKEIPSFIFKAVGALPESQEVHAGVGQSRVGIQYLKVVWMSSSCVSQETCRTRSSHIKKLKHSLWRDTELSRTDPQLTRAAFAHQESVQVELFYKRVEACFLNFSQARVIRTTQNLVLFNRNVSLCSGVIALEDSSGLASFSAWKLSEKMNHSFLSSLAQTTGVVERLLVRNLVLSPSPVFRLCRFRPELEHSA